MGLGHARQMRGELEARFLLGGLLRGGAGDLIIPRHCRGRRGVGRCRPDLLELELQLLDLPVEALRGLAERHAL